LKETSKRKGEIDLLRGSRLLLVLLVLVSIGLYFAQHMKMGNKPAQKIYSEFFDDVRKGQVEKVVVTRTEIQGTYKPKPDGPGGEFVTYAPNDPDLFRFLRKYNVATQVDNKDDAQWWNLAGLFLPAILVFLLIYFVMRQAQAGGSQAFSFGRSKARLLNENRPKVSFNDVAGVDEARQELEEIVEFLKYPKKFQMLGARIPKGVLLVGPPGSGKTLLGRAIAGEAGVPFFYISGSDFVEMFVGVGAARVRDLFEQAKRNSPCIVFIDEIDAVGRQRGAGLGGGHDEREQTLNQLLVEMDGFEPNNGVILLAATNRPDVLDPAILRPGRFDRQVVLDKPDIAGRTAILQIHSRKKVLGSEVDLELIAKRTPGFSGADLENLLNEAALLAARTGKKAIDLEDCSEAIDRVHMGPAKKSRIMSDKDKLSTAYHEAGHALVARLTPAADPVRKVTILPRGMALGVTWLAPDEDKYNRTKEELVAKITVAMGGRVAEELALSEISTGASNDIENATDVARRMVTEYGMSERLGPLSFGRKHRAVFLGRDLMEDRDYSEDIANQIDSEVKLIVSQCYETAKKLLSENRPTLDRVVKELQEHEVIDGTDLDAIIRGETINRPKPTPPPSAESGPEVRPAAEQPRIPQGKVVPAEG